MPSTEFILQGFTARTHADAVRELFNVPEIQRVLLSVAYVSESGVKQIADQLRASAAHVTVFAGIRNDITSLQALALLHTIIGDRLYTVDTGARSLVFHPKLYLVRGRDRAGLLVGSANLTLAGLNNNVEAGIVLNLDMRNDADRTVVKSIETQLLSLPGEYPANVVQVGAAHVLDNLRAAGLLVDETARPPPKPRTSAAPASAPDTTPRIVLKVPPIHAGFKKAVSKTAEPATPAIPVSPVDPAAVGVQLEEVWAMDNLTMRDLNIPDGANTNKTGSINLDKGLLPDTIDFQDYFRQDVFQHLAWSTRSPTVDEATATFQLVLRAIDYGDFELTIRHTTDKSSESYRQKNAMTRLSWGPIAAHISKQDLIGRSLTLYRDTADPKKFVLEID